MPRHAGAGDPQLLEEQDHRGGRPPRPGGEAPPPRNSAPAPRGKRTMERIQTLTGTLQILLRTTYLVLVTRAGLPVVTSEMVKQKRYPGFGALLRSIAISIGNPSGSAISHEYYLGFGLHNLNLQSLACIQALSQEHRRQRQLLRGVSRRDSWTAGTNTTYKQ